MNNDSSPRVTDPATIARTFAALVDVLLPGDDDFPPASATGIQAVVLDRLRARIGWEGIELIASCLDEGTEFTRQSGAGRVDSVKQLENDHTELFTHLRFVTYLAYYESPAVVRTLQSLGHDYNDAPLPLGYRMEPFDARLGYDLPQTPRGGYLKTEEIERIDLSSLAELDLPKVMD